MTNKGQLRILDKILLFLTVLKKKYN